MVNTVIYCQGMVIISNYWAVYKFGCTMINTHTHRALYSVHFYFCPLWTTDKCCGCWHLSLTLNMIKTLSVPPTHTSHSTLHTCRQKLRHSFQGWDFPAAPGCLSWVLLLFWLWEPRARRRSGKRVGPEKMEGRRGRREGTGSLILPSNFPSSDATSAQAGKVFKLYLYVPWCWSAPFPSVLSWDILQRQGELG